MNASDDTNSSSQGTWGGYDSLEAEVEALRRARFRVHQTFEVSGRGLVAHGEIVEGTITPGMVVLPVLERYPNVCVAVSITAIEEVRAAIGGAVGLGLDATQSTMAGQRLHFAPGTVIDVLQHAPAA
jgi:hypothetical protein